MSTENFKDQPNRLLNLSQAAQVLGYKDYRKIDFFIQKGMLTPFKMPHTNRFKIPYHEVMQLPTLIKFENQSKS